MSRGAAALIAGVLAVVAIGFVLLTYYRSVRLTNVLTCKETVVSASESQDKTNVAIAATTTCRKRGPHATFVRVGPRNAPAYVYDANEVAPVKVRWLDNKTVEIDSEIDPTKVTRRDTKAGDIFIVYKR